MKPSSKKNKNLIFPYFLLFLQPVFMASNLIVARGGVEFVPPVSLAFWRWTTVFILLIPFFYKPILKKIKIFKDEFLKLFFLGLTGCGICGAFPFIAGQTTTVVNMAVIYTSSPIFIILLSSLIYKEKIKLIQILGLILCLFGVFSIIFKGNVSILSNLDFTVGDIWMLGAAISWALYSVYLLNWKSKFDLITRFVLIAMFGSISLLIRPSNSGYMVGNASRNTARIKNPMIMSIIFSLNLILVHHMSNILILRSRLLDPNYLIGLNSIAS